jgi:hypothetical protein
LTTEVFLPHPENWRSKQKGVLAVKAHDKRGKAGVAAFVIFHIICKNKATKEIKRRGLKMFYIEIPAAVDEETCLLIIAFCDLGKRQERLCKTDRHTPNANLRKTQHARVK